MTRWEEDDGSVHEDCWLCDGTGEAEHDCMEDVCVCLHPAPGRCDECGGRGTLILADAQ